MGHKSLLAFGLIGEGDGVPVVAMLGRVIFAQMDVNNLPLKLYTVPSVRRTFS